MTVTENDRLSPLALKGQKLLAQGSTLGKIRTQTSRPVRAKALKYQVIYKAFALTGRPFVLVLKPRAMPWARSFWAFSPFLNHIRSSLIL